MNFTLLGNIIKTELSLPIQLSEDYVLDRANETEVKIIRKRMDASFQQWFILPGINPFEKRKEDSQYVKLENSELNYWVIRHEEDSRISCEQEIFNLLQPHSIFPIATFYIDENGECSGSGRPLNIKNIVNNLSLNFSFSEINSSTISLFQLLRKKTVTEQLSKYSFIKSSIDDFYKITEIPSRSNLIIIGYFSIIEKLLSSRKSFQINSINFQLQNKLNLINNRSQFKLDLLSQTRNTDKTTFQTIIQLLYKYRSCIAHGSPFDFDNELQSLKNSKNADRLIYELCKLTIVCAVKEPSLIADLREC